MREYLLDPILNIIRTKKKYIFLTSLLSFVFAVMIFPYDDLSDVITQQIATQTQNQVFMKFESLSLGLLPPSIKMKNVSVDTPFFPSLLAGQLNLAPSIMGLLKFSPGVHARIYEVLGGNISLSYTGGRKINDQIRLQNIDLDLKKMDLKTLSKFANLNLNLQGQLSSQLSSEFDPNFLEQPDGKVKIEIKNFNLPQATVATPMGPLTLPDVKLSNVVLTGILKNSQFQIESGDIGTTGDSIIGKMTGRLGIRLVKVGNSVRPEWGNYELNLDLNFDRNIDQSVKGLFSILNIDKYKTATSIGSRYAFHVSGPNFMALPNISSYK